MANKKIGIIGGMGPYATLDLFDWLIKLTPVNQDQDHLPVIIDNKPQIPDRTNFLLGQGEDPRPQLIESAQQLENAGVQYIAMPCNTAHAFIQDIKSNLKGQAEMINMLEETKLHIDKLTQHNTKPTKIGLIASDGTIQTKLYQNYFKNYDLITPNKEVQKTMVNESIYGKKGIKNGYLANNRQILKTVCQILVEQGANIVILGCTEVSAALKNHKTPGVIYINPVKILANNLVKRSLNHVI